MSIYNELSNRKIARCALSRREFNSLQEICRVNRVGMSEYIRGIIIDVLVEEGFGEPIQSQGRSAGREGRQNQGRPPQGDYTPNHVAAQRPGMDS